MSLTSTESGEPTEVAFRPGSKVFSLNPKYKDGTRLRVSPLDQGDGNFNGVWLPNDVKVLVLEVENDFVLIQKDSGEKGWIRSRNLTHTGRVSGVTKGVPTNEVVTPDPEYVKGVKLYNIGIKEDPVAGQKMGKGVQHLISSQWISAMSEFVAAHFKQLQAFVAHAKRATALYPGYDYLYFTNTANQLFHRADAGGLCSSESLEDFLAATWLVMAAAEVDDFPYSRYTREQRAVQREEFYASYLSPRNGPGVCVIERDDACTLGKFAIPLARRDLLPPVAMERLGINNELSSLKYSDPEEPMRVGFKLSARIDSLKRHFEAVHRRMTDEDHITHLLWNFHAIYHVRVVFPEKNDLVNYTALEKGRTGALHRAAYNPTTSLDAINSGKVPASSVLKLDWNEGTIPPAPSVRSAIVSFVQAGDGAQLKWYPHLAGGAALRTALAEYCGVIAENIIVTNGSDDALILLCYSYLGYGQTALAPIPTYEHFCVNAVNSGASLIRANIGENPFAANPEVLCKAIEEHHPVVVYLVSPNNPTGVHWTPTVVKGLATRFSQVVFIVDEAYYEFGSIDPSTEKPYTCVQLAASLTNVVVTRTFSKAFCLASLRCGYLVAHPNVIETLRVGYNPKSVNQIAQVGALCALREFSSYYAPYVAATNKAREAFLTCMRSVGVEASNGGGGNFVCIRVPEGTNTQDLCAKLEQQAIFVRDINARFPGYIRITIGLDMSRVEAAIIEALGLKPTTPPSITTTTSSTTLF
ncbi:histidinol-phosphate transaminase [Pelomyxa schiedti]|nr:histidinol-phosphate transaminase [Pelomyxa schiedti]